MFLRNRNKQKGGVPGGDSRVVEEPAKTRMRRGTKPKVPVAATQPHISSNQRSSPYGDVGGYTFYEARQAKSADTSPAQPAPLSPTTPQRMAQPVAQPVTQPVAQPLAQRVAQPVRQPVAQPAAQLVAPHVAHPPEVDSRIPDHAQLENMPETPEMVAFERAPENIDLNTEEGLRLLLEEKDGELESMGAKFSAFQSRLDRVAKVLRDTAPPRD